MFPHIQVQQEKERWWNNKILQLKPAITMAFAHDRLYYKLQYRATNKFKIFLANFEPIKEALLTAFTELVWIHRKAAISTIIQIFNPNPHCHY
jgi:hypothetical protein